MTDQLIAETEATLDSDSQVGNGQLTHDMVWRLLGALRQAEALIYNLETRCDPAGEVAELMLTRDQNAQLQEKLAGSIAAEGELNKMLAEGRKAGMEEAIVSLQEYIDSQQPHLLRAATWQYEWQAAITRIRALIDAPEEATP